MFIGCQRFSSHKVEYLDLIIIGFNTAVLQTYARKKLEPIDTLTFRTNVLKKYAKDVDKTQVDGLNIYGLFLQGGGWNFEKTQLKEAEEGQLTIEVPVIW